MFYDNNETRLEFGGFYESIHKGIIDSQIESFIEFDNDENDTNKTEEDYNFNYSLMYQDYIEQYCKLLEDYILNEYNIDVNFTDLKLVSPQYYNFETDKIECKLDKPSTIRDYFKTHEDFLDYLQDATQSYDGYTSYYNFDEALNNKNNILLLYIFQYICNKFYNTDNFYDIYVDIIEEDSMMLA